VFFYAGIGFVEPMVEGLKKCGKISPASALWKEMEGIKNFQRHLRRIGYSAFDRAMSTPGKDRKKCS